MVTVSILIPCYKSEDTIRECLDSLIHQSFNDLEIVIVEDPPFDSTEKIVESLSDKRIKYIKNESRAGLSESRNITVKNSEGEYLFFIDSDCIASPNWIESGLQTFQESDCLGVEGKIYYVSENYEPTYSERVVRNLYGKQYMTANIAYKKDIIRVLGGFDRELTCYEDREIAIRVLNKGKIIFNPSMVVFHKKEIRKPKQFLRTGNSSRNMVRIYKKHNFKLDIYWRIMFPFNLLEIVFPPILLLFPFKYKFKTVDDWILLLLTWPRLLYERLCFWDEAIKQKVFLI